ncbi:MAG: MMPL family transporter [Clostridia bacterium]|nr:MMPL family transporter [Clostridia bacterium]
MNSNVINKNKISDSEEKNSGIMMKIAAFIVDKRRAFYLIFAAVLVLCLISIPKVKVNNDISSYLPNDTETRRGLTLMDEEFITYDTETIMVTTVTKETAEELKEKMEKVDGVKQVEFEDDEDHYKQSAALFTVTLDVRDDLDRELEIVQNVKNQLEGYDYYAYSDSIDDSSKTLAQEMTVILAIAVLIIIAVLLFTSSSFMEIPIFLIVFIVAALLNMGTNYLLGEISFITNSVAVVLQLALAIDYAIILSHRFAEEKLTKNSYDAIVAALSKAIIEISSSSLTTLAGLAALMVMQLRIGMDMGLVLCKGIICSLLTVFLIMPGLLLAFSDKIDKTTHKSFVPSIQKWCDLMIKLRHVVPYIFIVVIVVSAVLSSMSDYAFDVSSQQMEMPTESAVAKRKVNEIFGTDHQLAVIVPAGDYDKEAKVISLIEKNPNINSALGLANTEIDDDHILTDRINAREMSKLMDIDYDLCVLLFQAYGAEHDEYSAIFSDVNDYEVPIIDLFLYTHEKMDLGVINLDEEQTNDLNELYDTLIDAKAQLESDNYSRMVFTYTCDVESDEAYQMLKDIRGDVERYYDECLLVSDSVNSRDLGDSFSGDNNKINIITLLALLLILMVTFRSAGVPVILVLAIQGSVWINFSIPFLASQRLYFLAYLVVSSIQMGATIDYAIVFTNRYLTLKETMDRKEAAAAALNQSFPTILTSGSILTISGFLIGMISTNAIISALGAALGRGTLISIVIVMMVLPQIVLLCDKFIEKTAFGKKAVEADKAAKREMSGVMIVNGRIRGNISGFVDGMFYGVVKGDVNARMELGNANALLEAGKDEEYVKEEIIKEGKDETEQE